MSDLGAQAIAAWRKAFATGEFDDLLGLADPTIQFRLGVAPYHVEHSGKAALEAAVEFLREKEIRVTQEPLSPPLHGASSTVFEFRATGAAKEHQFQADFLVVFGFKDGRIVRMMEYAPPAG